MIHLDEDEVRSLFSEYLEGELSPELRDSVQVYLSSNPTVAAELIDYQRTIDILHRLPEREPVLDMWSAIAPTAQQYKVEFRLSLRERLIHKWQGALAAVNEGILFYTRQVAARAHGRLTRNLLHTSDTMNEGGTDA